jgi:hypothetical protein
LPQSTRSALTLSKTKVQDASGVISRIPSRRFISAQIAGAFFEFLGTGFFCLELLGGAYIKLKPHGEMTPLRWRKLNLRARQQRRVV